MANITAFKGLRYNKEKVSNLASVITPPYDIIDETSQARYYAEHPANIIRLELGLIFPQDSANNNRYTRAAQYLEKWLEDETLMPEKKPAFYLYQQEFSHHGNNLVRNGIICGLRVEDYDKGNILPHEETLSKPKADRLYLMRSTQSNFSSIFGMYADKENYINTMLLNNVQDRTPEIEIIDEANEIHRVWVIDDEEIVDNIVGTMLNKKIYIADGHHRYETALEYYKNMKEQGYQGYDYVMATLVNLYDEGLVVFPTHRVVGNINNFKIDELIKKLSRLFAVEVYSGSKDNLTGFIDELKKKGQATHTLGMYSGNKLYFLELTSQDKANNLLPADKSNAWKDLDVAILDNLILDGMLNIGAQERRNQDNLAYTRSETWLVEQIDNKHYQLGFILNPTRVEEIVAVADARDKMPQKSTYFYPKLITGLVINYLNIK